MVWNEEFCKRFASIATRALNRLGMLDAAMSLKDLRSVRGNRLEALASDRKGQYSIRINDQYRICFEWKGENACRVEITDYP